MLTRDFCYWLQGFFEIQSMTTGLTAEASGLNASQVSMIRNHLNLVFAHDIDPSMGPPKHQAKLNDLHTGGVGVNPNPNIIARC